MSRGAPRAVMFALAAGLLAGCGGGSNTGGSSSISLTAESLQFVPGNQCAVLGTATNVGNLTVHVTISWEARNGAGVVIGTSSAAFQVDPFSSFQYGFFRLNTLTQPSSGPFTNSLSCGAISSFQRTALDISI